MIKSTADIIVKPIQTYRQQSRLNSVANEPISPSEHDQRSQQLPAAAFPHYSHIQPKKTRRIGGTAGAVFASGASSVGGVVKTGVKGVYVDIPLALADGFRTAPRLYGEEVRERAPITDWKSGVAVGGRNFATGIAEGLAGLVVLPYKGGAESGPAGVAMGFGKGVIGLATKTVSGEFPKFHLVCCD